jgi:arylsulfatase A
MYGDTVLIDHTFDGSANDTGPAFQEVTNGLGSGGSSDLASGRITTGTGVSNSTYGFNNGTTVDVAALDPLADGFTVTFEVSSIEGGKVSDLRANGLFFGFVSGSNATGTDGPSLWNNNPDAFGYVAGSGDYGANVMRQDGATNFTLTTTRPTDASFADGFTLSITLFSDDSWSLTSTGLSINLNNSGNLNTLDFSYADIVNDLGLYVSLQGLAGVSIDIDRITLTTVTVSDTDSDEMPDFWEDANGLNKEDPSDADLDNDTNGGPDGLSNLEEFQNGTDPQIADSDEDGLQDGDEVDGTLNPWTARVKGTPPGDPTDPLDADSDDDGISDGDEIAAGTDPNAPPPNTGLVVPFVDTDGDSYRDSAETALGSDPNNPDDIPDFSPGATPPNVVIIYADDLGFGDIAHYGKLFGTPSPAATPNVDRLASEGVTFTQGHSANAVCTPSRYSLLTGIYNWRLFNSISSHYGHKNGLDNIPADSDVTIAEFLKGRGYDTAAFGKWHLGGKWYAPGSNTRITGNPTNPAAVDWTRRIEGHATDIGFDTFRGLGAVINFGPYVYLHDDIVQYWEEDTDPINNEYGDKLPNGRKGYFRPATSNDSFIWLSRDDLNASVVGATDSRASLADPSYRQIDAGPIMVADFERYIDERVASGDTDPLFAYIPLYSPHKPWAITPNFNNDTYGTYDYARFMSEVDDRIGRILAAIDDNGMKENTLVIMTSDNGPAPSAMIRSLENGDDSNGPLRGLKRDAWEGGTRVPFIVRWPGQAPAGMIVTDEIISQVDIFPTIAAFLREDLAVTTAPDGESFLNVVRGQRKPGPDRGGIVLCSIGGHLALKTPSGWKLIDSTGGGGSYSWNSDNERISNAQGINRGVPKQLFNLPVDLGEDDNRIADLANESTIRSELVALTGSDLLGVLDQLRSSGAASLYPREPDNDADGMSNRFETLHGLDPDSPVDATLDHDGDGADNLSESIAGTDPNNNGSVFRLIDMANSAGTFSITWPSVVDRDYEVFWSTDLENWTSDSTREGTGTAVTVDLDKTAIDLADGVTGNLQTLFVRTQVFPQPN